MGGRGSSSSGYSGSGKGFIGAGKGGGGQIQPLAIAGLTGTDENGGFRYTSVEQTLQHLEPKTLDMKREQMKVIDDDGFVIAAYQGNAHSVAFIPEQTRGKTVTHNHPSGYGGTFSEADVGNFLEFGQKEIRASAKEGTYSLKRVGKKQNDKGFNDAYAKAQGRLDQKARAATQKAADSGGSRMAQRKAYVDVYHNWYKSNASKYGFEYTFKANKGYKVP